MGWIRIASGVCLGVAGLGVTSWCAPAAAQESGGVLRIFLDCQTRGCDFDHFRREIRFVSWVRNREDAAVHVLVTGRQTGGGGREFTVTYIGRGRFAGRSDTLVLATDETETDAEVRGELTRVLGVGLLPYAAVVNGPAGFSVTYDRDSAQAARDGDPGGGWDYWVFRVRGGGFVAGESQENSLSVNGGIVASRVTEALKVRMGANGRYSRDEFSVDEVDETTGDTTTVTEAYTQRNWNTYALTGWSIGEHWAAGGRGEIGASTFYNQDLSVRAGPMIEYSVFPYSESTRREFAFTFSVGAAYDDYTETTIFGLDDELHPVHVLEARFSQRQTWGSMFAGAEWFQYWHDLNAHLIEVDGGAEIRIVKGLSLDLFGRFARVKDQLYLSASGLSEEDILLRQRARGTDYRFFLNFGLSYTFGATDNSIVNPRLDF